MSTHLQPITRVRNVLIFKKNRMHLFICSRIYISNVILISNEKFGSDYLLRVKEFTRISNVTISQMNHYESHDSIVYVNLKARYDYI